MNNQFAFTTLLAAALLGSPQLSRADDAQTRWESLRVYTLPSGNSVAVAVPSEWDAVNKGVTLVGKQPLRFRDASGAEVAVSTVTLEQASADKRVFRPDLSSQRVAQSQR
jgi:hypothetical protein